MKTKIGDQINIKGKVDRVGYKIPAGPWFICLIEDIPRMPAIVATNGQQWIAGRFDIQERPGYPPSHLYGDDALTWETEQAARENHEERVAGEVL